MADGIGVDGIHSVTGTCDLCGHQCDSNTQELNVLGCTFKNCVSLPYHQDCLEKYLKSIRLERNRKTGFKCPRGCGKGSQYTDACPGKIDKSHPIHPRNEESKKRKKAKLPEVPVVPARAPTRKEEKATVKASGPVKGAKEAEGKAKPAAAKIAAANPKPAAAKAKAPAPPPPDPKHKLAEAVAAARREINGSLGSRRDSTASLSSAHSGSVAAAAPSSPRSGGGGGGTRTLDAYLSAKDAARGSSAGSSSLAAAAAASSSSAGGGAAPANPWGKPPAPLPVPRASKVSAAATAAPAQQRAAATSPFAQAPAPWGGAATAAAASGPAPGWQALGAFTASRAASGLSQGGSDAAAHAGSESLPVGMEYVSDEEDGDGARLTRAQKKNLKRAEKKKKAGDGGGEQGAGDGAAAAAPAGGATSGATSPPGAAAAPAPAAAEADHEGDNIMYDLALQALLARRALTAVAMLQRMGWPEWAAAAAVQLHGDDAEAACAWLLEGGADSPATAAEGIAGCSGEVNLDGELESLSALAAAYQVAASALYPTVVDAGGDLAAVADALAGNQPAQQQQPGPSQQQQPQHESQAAAPAAQQQQHHHHHQQQQQQQQQQPSKFGAGAHAAALHRQQAEQQQQLAAAAAASACAAWDEPPPGTAAGHCGGAAGFSALREAYNPFGQSLASQAATSSSSAAAAGGLGALASSNLWAPHGSPAAATPVQLPGGRSSLLVSSDPVVEPPASGTAGGLGGVPRSTSRLFTAYAAAPAGSAGGWQGEVAAGAGSLYGAGSGSLFGGVLGAAGAPVLARSAGSGDGSGGGDETDLEGLLATLMCH